jgi:hypothetical protein
VPFPLPSPETCASPDRIPWCQELRDRFTARVLPVRKHKAPNTPENPSNVSFSVFQYFSVSAFQYLPPVPVLLPKDPAFHPEPAGLEWRLKKLSA